MTTFAYKNGFLAADTLITYGNGRLGHMSKIVKNDKGWLFAASGTIDGVKKILDWGRRGYIDRGIPNIEGTDGFVVEPDGQTYSLVKGELVPFLITGKGYAEGTGGNYAEGAMEAGASAKQAVEIAMIYDTKTGGTIEVLKLGLD